MNKPSPAVTPREIDESIENDLDFWMEQKHQDDAAQLEWSKKDGRTRFWGE